MDAGTAMRSVRYAFVTDRFPVVHVLRETPPAEAPRPKLLDRLPSRRPRPPLQPQDREGVRPLGQALHLLPRQAPPRRDGRARKSRRFLTALAVRERVAASTQNQALNALLFLYREILGVELPWLDDLVRAKRPQHLPTVLTRDEVRTVIDRVDGVPRLIALLLYGAGLRLLECCRLRIKDLDFTTNQITIRGGKGGKDRLTMFPGVVKDDLAKHLERVRRSTSATSATAPAGSSCHGRSLGSIRMQAASGPGSGCSPRRASTWTATPASAAVTICTSRSSNEPSARPC